MLKQKITIVYEDEKFGQQEKKNVTPILCRKMLVENDVPHNAVYE